MLKSRYKISQLILIGFASLLLFVMPFLVLTGSKSVKHEYLFLLLPVMGFFLFYSTFQNSPRIIFDDAFITARYLFISKTYNWSSIQDIYLSNKQSYLLQRLEATTILFDDGRKLNIWHDMYSNCEPMRALIFQKVAEKIRDPRPNIVRSNLQVINRKRYSGNVYTSFNTLLIIGMFIFMAVSIKGKTESYQSLFFPAGFCLILFLGFGTQMNYFLIDEGCLVIRNQYFPWKNISIKLEDIVEVDIETPNKRSTGLRVITNDFHSKLYGAGSLRDHNWKELLSDLQLIGIPARDDR